jgi:hypothetical protein
MACLMKVGSLPAARNPDQPTPQERDATHATVARYQQVFDTHVAAGGGGAGIPLVEGHHELADGKLPGRTSRYEA